MADQGSIPLLGAILLERGKVRPEMLDHALRVQRASPTAIRLGEVLLKLGYIAEQDLLEALQAQRSMAEEVAQLLSPPEECPTLLLVSASEAVETGLRTTLTWSLYNLVRVDPQAAVGWARSRNVQAMLWEIDTTEGTSLQSLRGWRQACPDLPLIVLVQETCPARVIEQVLQVGADQMLVLPLQERRLVWALHRALARQRQQERIEAQRVRLNHMGQILVFLDMLDCLLADAPDMATLAAGLTSGVTSLLEAEACLVQWGCEKTTFISGPHSGYIEGSLPEGLQQALDCCRRQAEPFCLDNLWRHPVWGNLPFDLPELAIHTLLCAPLCVGRQGLGAIAVINRLDGAPFSPEDRQLLASVAGPVTLALENARLRGREAPSFAGIPMLPVEVAR